MQIKHTKNTFDVGPALKQHWFNVSCLLGTSAWRDIIIHYLEEEVILEYSLYGFEQVGA